MAWLVIAPVEGVGPTRIVSDSSWKGWPKAKDGLNKVIDDQKMAGKYRYHVIGESPDGKTIPQEIKQPVRARRPIEAPPEAVEIVQRKAQPQAEEAEEVESEPVEVTAPLTSPVADPNAVPEPVVKNKGGRPKGKK